MKYLVLLLAFLACPSLSGAQATYTAASCDPAAINLQISKEHIHPVDGDIIAIPACTDTWTNTNAGTQVSGLFTKNVTIQGAGSVYACGTHGSTTCGSYQTEIIDNISNAHNNLMNFSIAAGKTIRVTGVALVENSSIQSSDGQLKITGAWTSQIRVDHCQLSSGYEGLQIFGPVIGVADHNYFSVSKLTLNNNVSIRNGANWGGLSDSGGNAVGDRSWAAPENWGTKYFFFIEDNQFHNGGASDCFINGARYVMRYNTMVADSGASFEVQLYNHGLSSNRGRGCRASEVYGNNFVGISNATQGGNPTHSPNSGSSLYWGNTVNSYTAAVQISYTRQTNATYPYGAQPTGWGNCSNLGGAVWDGSTGPGGYPCLDQPGRGAGDFLINDFPKILDSVTKTATWPHQAVSPIYIWSNTLTNLISGGSLVKVDGSGVIANNKEYYEDVGAKCERNAATCSTGVGVGTLAQRPAHCVAGPGGTTPGVAWWATDQQTLYICNPTNTWTTYYTPYTYPHPLADGPGASGSNTDGQAQGVIRVTAR